MKRSRVSEVLLAEGLKWRQEETWFGARVDPEFERKSRMSEILLAEGLKWRQEETWFGARVDPEFERKRGRSSASTPPRPRAA